MTRYSKYIKLIILIAVISIVALSPIKKYITIDRLSLLIQDIKNYPYAPLIYVLICITGVILAVPGTALTITAAPIFGFWKGLLLVVIGANIGCNITFFISRFFGAEFVQRFIKTDSKLANLSGKIENNGFLFMLYLRILPFFPFNVLNYLSGLTTIKYKDYALASLIGMFPGTFSYVYFTYTVADISNNPYGILLSIAFMIVFTLTIMYFKKRNESKFEEQKND